MEDLKNTLCDLLERIKTKDQKYREFILKGLDRVLTKKEIQHIKYISLHRDILKLGVDSSGWLYQLNQKKQKILDKLKLKEVKFYLV
jgi:hypothetical protein